MHTTSVGTRLRKRSISCSVVFPSSQRKSVGWILRRRLSADLVSAPGSPPLKDGRSPGTRFDACRTADSTPDYCFGSTPVSLLLTAIALKTLNEFYKKGCQEKSSPATGGREDFVSRSSPLHCKSVSRSSREVLLLSCLPFLYLSSSGGDHANRVLGHGKRRGYLSGNHSSIGGSWPIAISGYPRRHSV